MFGFLKARKPEEQHPLEPESDADAQQRLAAALEDADRRGISSARRVELRIELAEAQCRQEKFRDAETTLRKALVLCAQATDVRLFLNCLDTLAEVFSAMGNFPGMEEATQEAIRMSAALPQEDAPHKDARMYRLAMAQHKNGHFTESIASFEKVIALRERAYGPNHLETGNLLSEVGRLCLGRNEHEKAQHYLRRALHIHEAERGVDSAEANQDVEDLAGSFEASGDVDGAATQYERALTLKMRKLGCGNIDEVAEMQYHLANLHAGWGNLCRAQELLEGCIGTFRRTGGPRLAVAYETLAQVEEGLGRISFAVAEMEKAAKAWEKCTPARVQELARNLDYRADLLDQLRQRREADWLRKQAAELLAGELTASAKIA